MIIEKIVIVIKTTQKITAKNKIKYLEGKLFKVHGLYFKLIAQRNIPIIEYMLVIIAYVAIRDSALIAIIIDHIIFSMPCKTIQTMSEIH